jgi:hypothetical protein
MNIIIIKWSIVQCWFQQFCVNLITNLVSTQFLNPSKGRERHLRVPRKMRSDHAERSNLGVAKRIIILIRSLPLFGLLTHFFFGGREGLKPMMPTDPKFANEIYTMGNISC